jgi:hypothetical protein
MDSDMLASADEKGTPFTYAYTSRYCPARKISPKAYQVSIKGVSLKVHKHENIFLTFFAETGTLWSQGPVTQDF